MQSTDTNAGVAVVVTCHDDGDTLVTAIDSIRGQGEAVELVIVDDGSSDQTTLRLLSQLERDREIVIRQANQGQSAAAMTGLRSASAAFVMRFDADDVLLPGAIAALRAALERDPGAAAAWGDTETFGLTSFRIPAAPQLDPWLVTYTNCIPGSGTLYRRAAVEAAGGWRLPAGFEDWDLWMALAERGYRGVHVARPIFRYRQDRHGQLAVWLPRTDRHYEQLRSLHPRLFANRRVNARRSTAPFALKLAVTTVERIGWLPRLSRIQLCELFTHLLWNGGLVATSKMVARAAALRIRRR
jgi:glycosyltransferase involved in cell wall biosynthesis